VQWFDPAAQCHINPRQGNLLERLLEAGPVRSGGGFLGGMTNDKCTKITGTSKSTATRCAVNMPGCEQSAFKP
jgi:hypothetical protein